MALFKDTAQYKCITVAQGIKQDRPPVRMVEGAADAAGVFRCIVEPDNTSNKGLLYATFARPDGTVQNGGLSVDDENAEERYSDTQLYTLLRYYNRHLADRYNKDVLRDYYALRVGDAVARYEELANTQAPSNIASEYGLKLTARDGTPVDVRNIDGLTCDSRPGNTYVKILVGRTQPKVFFSEIGAGGYGMAAIVGMPICRGHLEVPKRQYGTLLRVTFKLQVSDAVIRNNIVRQMSMPTIFYDIGQIDGHPFINTLRGGELKRTNTNTASVRFDKPITPSTVEGDPYEAETTFVCNVEVPASKLFLLTVDTLTPAWDLMDASIGNAVSENVGESLKFACDMKFKLSIVSAEPI